MSAAKRITMSPPAEALQCASVRAVHGAYCDALQAAVRLIERLVEAGQQEHADAMARDTYALARRAERHMMRLAAQARRESAANHNGEHAA
jgi:cob(I)alamin adenosyltransferase